MSQRTRVQYASGGPPAADDSDRDLPGTVNVRHLSFGANLPLVGRTVGETRRLMRDRLDIDPRAEALIDGRAVDDNVVLQAGAKLVFSVVLAEKGG